MYKSRAPRYRTLKGLKQKYYLRFIETGEPGAVYLWESEAAMKMFRESELGQTISTAYEVKETPEVLFAEVVMTAHPS